MSKKQPNLLPKHREIIAAKQGGKCCYCGITMLRAAALTPDRKPHPRAVTIEHLRRRCEGGTNHLDNKAAACRQCNTGRGSMDWLTYKSIKMGEIFA